MPFEVAVLNLIVSGLVLVCLCLFAARMSLAVRFALLGALYVQGTLTASGRIAPLVGC